MSDAIDRRHSPRIKFDPTINLGHILTFVGFLATGFGAYTLLERRVTILEERSLRAIQDSSAARVELKEATREMRDELREVQRTVNQLQQSLVPRGDRK